MTAAWHTPEMVADVPVVRGPGYRIAGDLRDPFHGRLGEREGNRHVAMLLVEQLQAEQLDLRGKMWLECTDDVFVCYARSDQDIALVSELLRGLAAGTLGPVDDPPATSSDVEDLPSQPLP